MVLVAVGLATCAVVAALVQAVLLRPLPIRDEGRIVVGWKSLPSSGYDDHPFGNLEIEHVGRSSRLLERVAGIDANGTGRDVLAEGEDARWVATSLVAGDLFGVLGAMPVRGRLLSAADDVEGADPVIVISEGLWLRRFGGATVIGRRVSLSDRRFTIVGVVPRGLDYPQGTEVWRTTHSVSTDGPFGDAARREVNLVARLRPGVTIEAAAAELGALTRRYEEELATASAPKGLLPTVRPIADVMFGDVRPALVLIATAAGVLWLVVTASIANLLLTNAESWRADAAVQTALGATPARAGRRHVVAALLLGLAGAVSGLAVAWWGVRVLPAYLPATVPRANEVRLGPGVVAFVLLIALFTSMLAALPVWFATRTADLASLLRESGRAVTSARARRTRRALVMGQVGLAVVVVWAAGLLSRTVVRLQAADTGLAVQELVLVELAVSPSLLADRERHSRFLRDLAERLETIPGILRATPVNAVPFSGNGWDVPRFTAEGQTDAQAESNPALDLEAIHPGHFAALGVPNGRWAHVQRRRPGGCPTGRHRQRGRRGPHLAWRRRDRQTREDGRPAVPGQLADDRRRGQGHAVSRCRARAAHAVPAGCTDARHRTALAVRTTLPVGTVSTIARSEVESLAPEVPVMGTTRFADLLARPLARPRLLATLLIAFACTATLLGGTGLYAVLAASIQHRQRELAIRQALGASSAHLWAMVGREAAVLTGSGLLVGVGGAAFAARLVRGLLHDVRPVDPVTVAAVVAVLVCVAVAAACGPARRATRSDAAAILRS